MAELITRVGRLVPYAKRPKTAGGFATAFVCEPTPEQSRHWGNLFLVVEVLTAGKQAEETADLIIRCLSEEYYADRSANVIKNDDTVDDPASELTSLDRFELALKAVNQELAHYVEAGHAGWVGKLSAVAAVQVGGDIHICHTGSAEAYLYRGNRTINLGSSSAKPQLAGTSKAFVDIASGELEIGDKLLLATPALRHQLALDRLKQLIHDNSPTGCVHKISELASQHSQAERIALLVIEATTPELASLQTLPTESPSTELGPGARPLDSAKAAVAPAFGQAAGWFTGTYTKLSHTIKTGLLPRVRPAIIAVIAWLRRWLASPRNRRNLVIGIVIILVFCFWFGYFRVRQQGLANLEKRYHTTLTREQTAEKQLAAGDSAGAKLNLTRAQTDLKTLAAEPLSKKLNAKLVKSTHPSNDPASISGLANMIQIQLDVIDGLSRAKPVLVQDFKSIAGAKPSLATTVAGQAIFFDNTKDKIYNLSLATNQLKTIDASSLGQVVAMTASSDGIGVFLMTTKPGVWLYRTDNSSLTEQSLSLSTWPKPVDIASYNSNFYVLGDDHQIYKFGRIDGGFSGKTPYLSTTEAASLTGASSLSIDGSVYVGGGASGGLKRYLSGALKQTETDLPQSLAHSISLESLAEGSLLLLVDGKSGRLGLVGFDGEALSYKKQLALTGVNKVNDAFVDSKARTIYVLADGKFWRTALAF